MNYDTLVLIIDTADELGSGIIVWMFFSKFTGPHWHTTPVILCHHDTKKNFWIIIGMLLGLIGTLMSIINYRHLREQRRPQIRVEPRIIDIYSPGMDSERVMWPPTHDSMTDGCAIRDPTSILMRYSDNREIISLERREAPKYKVDYVNPVAHSFRNHLT